LYTCTSTKFLINKPSLDYSQLIQFLFTSVVLNIVNLPVLQIGQKFSQPKGKGEDTYYSYGRSMLQELGLQNYEKNFKKGLLTDQTLPLLTDRYGHTMWKILGIWASGM
jgi:hypothetical protein